MLHHQSGQELSKRFKSGEISAEEIAKAFLQQVDTHDAKIRAFLTVTRDRALNQARLLDEKKRQGEALGALAAVPIAIKDNIHVKGERTTCGSKILGDFKAPFSATAVNLLEEAGALIIGKTNMDEFGMGSSTENSAFFPTCNPWNLNAIPGGSSGGSAAAVSSRMSSIALGSDTGGSVRQPAALCGVFGFKPSYGRVSRWGLVAYASSLDTIGTFAHDIEDIARVMEIIGTPCSFDSTCIPKPAENYQERIRSSLEGVRIGLPTHFLAELNKEAKEQFEKSIKQLEQKGCECVEINLDILKHCLAVYYIIATAEAATNLARFDGIRYGVRSAQATNLDELIRMSREEGFGKEVKRRILMGNFSLSSDQQEAFFRKAQKVRYLIMEQYKRAFDQCDLIAMPTSPTPAHEIGTITDPLQIYLSDIYTTSVNLAALPAISLPTGLSNQGMPWGLQLIAKHGEDRKLIQTASLMSQELDWKSMLASGY